MNRFDIPARAVLELDPGGRWGRIELDRIVVDGASQETCSPVRRIDVLLDVASVKVFVNDGEASLTLLWAEWGAKGASRRPECAGQRFNMLA